MLTTLSIAHMLAARLVRRLHAEDESGRSAKVDAQSGRDAKVDADSSKMDDAAHRRVPADTPGERTAVD